MASRLMLSLKKAAIEPTGPWSLTTMTNLSTGGAPEDSVSFASPGLGGSHEISETSAPRNEEDIELELMSRSPRNRGPWQLH